MKVEILPPLVPNFIRVSIGDRSETFPLSAFDDAEMERIVELWRKDLFARREEQIKSSERTLRLFPRLMTRSEQLTEELKEDEEHA